MEHLYERCAVLIYCLCFTLSLCPALSSFLFSSFHHPVSFFSPMPLQAFISFLAIWLFLSSCPVLSKKPFYWCQPFEILPRQHLWTPNGFPSCLFLSQKYPCLPLSPCPPSFSLLLFFSYPSLFSKRWLLFVLHMCCAASWVRHTHTSFSPCLFSLLPALCFLALLLLPWLTIEEWFNQGECPPFNPSHFSSPPPLHPFTPPSSPLAVVCS